jgi:ABC-type multidrug transport system fused ATPase/permease subunit
VTLILILTYFIGYFSKIASNYIGLTDVFGYSGESDKFLSELKGNEMKPNQFQGQLKKQDFNSNGPIQFKNVSFSYPNKERDVLKDVNLSIGPGEKIAIYGKSGSGKSTIIKLLLGFYGVNSGSIEINGTDIKNIDVNNLRKNIAVVNQNIKLFDKTIFENMTYGIEKDITEEDIQKIIGKMNIFETVEKGLGGNAGISGSNLSGGQKQITSLVRSILKNAPILVLDEPTSALDQKTKNAVLHIIKGIKNKTVIIITHDKSIIPYVDKVYELSNGNLNSL